MFESFTIAPLGYIFDVIDRHPGTLMAREHRMEIDPLGDDFSFEDDIDGEEDGYYWLYGTDKNREKTPRLLRTHIGRISVLCITSIVFGVLGGIQATQLAALGQFTLKVIAYALFPNMVESSLVEYIYMEGWQSLGLIQAGMMAVFFSYSMGFLGESLSIRRASNSFWCLGIAAAIATWATGCSFLDPSSSIFILGITAFSLVGLTAGRKVSKGLQTITEPMQFYKALFCGVIPAVLLLSPLASESLGLTLAVCIGSPILAGKMLTTLIGPPNKSAAALISISSMTPLILSMPFLLVASGRALATGLVSHALLWIGITLLMPVFVAPLTVLGSLTGIAKRKEDYPLLDVGGDEACSAARVSRLIQ